MALGDSSLVLPLLETIIDDTVLLLTLLDRTLLKFIVRKFVSCCLAEKHQPSNMQ